jgi:cell division protein FtsB
MSKKVLNFFVTYGCHFLFCQTIKSNMPRQEEQDYNDLLKHYHTLQMQHRNEVQKNKSLMQRIRKLQRELATLKLRQQAPPTTRTVSHSHQEKDEKDDILELISMRLTDAEKQLDLLKLENQVRQPKILSLSHAREEKLRKILQVHNEYKARHAALKDQMEEYKEEVAELREQNHFLEQQVTKLCSGRHYEDRDAFSQKESAYDLLLGEIMMLQRENEHLHLRLSRANHKAKDIRSCYRELEYLALEEAKLSESADSSYVEDP